MISAIASSISFWLELLARYQYLVILSCVSLSNPYGSLSHLALQICLKHTKITTKIIKVIIVEIMESIHGIQVVPRITLVHIESSHFKRRDIC